MLHFNILIIISFVFCKRKSYTIVSLLFAFIIWIPLILSSQLTTFGFI